MKKFIAALMATVIMLGILTSCSIVQGLLAPQEGNGEKVEDEEVNSATDDVLNGEYGLHHIVVESISYGTKNTYNIGDTYLGLVMSSNTISVALNNGSGTMTYYFGEVKTTNIMCVHFSK